MRNDHENEDHFRCLHCGQFFESHSNLSNVGSPSMHLSPKTT
jgi:Fe2+ or Zn2+ uptake regulation protein